MNKKEKKYGLISTDVVKSEYLELMTKEDATTWGLANYASWSNEYKKIMQINKKALEINTFTSPIEDYCGYLYIGINTYLRFGEKDENNICRELSHILAIALSSAPRIPENIVTYRVVSDEFIQELIKNNKEDIPTQERGFLSTSLITNIVTVGEAYNVHNNLLKIYVDKGSIGIYVNGVVRRNEQEVLLYPNGYLYLIEYPYKDENLNKIVYECKLFYFDK
ncbi:ADP-ribosyltransferase [Clostridioides difficile]